MPTNWTDAATARGVVRLVAVPGESISGAIRDGDGRPIRSASVQALDRAGKVVSAAMPDKEGKFELRGLSPGAYTVRALLPSTFGSDGKLLQGPQRDIAGVVAGTRSIDIRFDQ